MNDFKEYINERKICYNDSKKYDYYINIENKIQKNILKIFENYYNEYIKKNLIKKIFYFYITLIKNTFDIIVTKNLNAIKKDVISE